jgi:hypothetical protein
MLPCFPAIDPNLVPRGQAQAYGFKVNGIGKGENSGRMLIKQTLARSLMEWVRASSPSSSLTREEFGVFFGLCGLGFGLRLSDGGILCLCSGNM